MTDVSPRAGDEVASLQLENEALRATVERLERERAELVARTNAAVAAAEDKAYWLDRWGVDLNAVMRRRGASEFRALLRVVRAGYRRIVLLRRRLGR
jgi:hypothetical protein